MSDTKGPCQQWASRPIYKKKTLQYCGEVKHFQTVSLSFMVNLWILVRLCCNIQKDYQPSSCDARISVLADTKGVARFPSASLWNFI